jgi:nucleolar MIF4G domain-containing protein 1
LRIGLKDIQESDKKGKWWLVGASWSGPGEGGDDPASAIPTSLDRHSLEDPGTSDFSQLAREQRMNTEIRRGIFVAIMSASDYQDAYMRITKLQLKRKQEFEIPKVLIHCAGAEKSYNPYYTLIAKRLCGDVKLKKSFQFSLWDIFKKMGESDDDGDADDDYNDGDLLDTRQIVNLAKMFGSLIVEGGLGLGVLKNLSLSYLQPKTKTFIEVLFITLLLQSQKQAGAGRDEQAVVNIFLKLKDAPELIRGVQYFLKKVVSKSDITGGKEQQATVKWACKVAAGVLQELVAAGTTDE